MSRFTEISVVRLKEAVQGRMQDDDKPVTLQAGMEGTVIIANRSLPRQIVEFPIEQFDQDGQPLDPDWAEADVPDEKLELVKAY